MADLSKVNWDKTQPLILFMREQIPTYFPIIAEKHPRGRGVGGYVERTTKTGSFSFHSEGRAADIYLNAFDAEQRHIGDALRDGFIRYHQSLGVDHVIWNTKIWSVEKGGPRPYTGGNGPHTDHIHVAITKAGSQKKNPDLIRMLDEVSAIVFSMEIGYAFRYLW
ncbi:hypothetical protein G8759_06220 [Spirosoma aureum]|uniref:ARB-07466-like C-terminal domain-containing protein n=1 Tax=Spirosoma aureum TaxID=2692134 RepID=A0A6G9AIF2_9BACT|nr:hypothetical protein [Spirosoma aureum]QIP12252.1 hypothetical protein G8759_06220 [Spirosoma aureum]